MDVTEFEKSLKKLQINLRKKKEEKERKLKQDREQKQKKEQQKIHDLKMTIKQEIEKWNDLVSSHLLVLAKLSWPGGYTVVTPGKPKSDTISELAKTAIMDGQITYKWMVIKSFVRNLMQSKVESFSVTLHIIVDRENFTLQQSFLVVGADGMKEHCGEITTYEKLVPWLFRAFANGPCIEYDNDTL